MVTARGPARTENNSCPIDAACVCQQKKTVADSKIGMPETRLREVWPGKEFWNGAVLLISTLRNIDFGVFIKQLGLLGEYDISTSLAAFFSAEWDMAWAHIKEFMTTFPVIPPRCVSTLCVAYLFSLVCSVISGHKSLDNASREMLIGTCLGMVYSDARLDDATVTTVDRQKYYAFLEARFVNSDVEPFDSHSHAASTAFSMIEKHDTERRVRRSLRAIMTTHRCSVASTPNHMTIEESRIYAFQLGAETANVFASILDVQQGSPEWEAIELLGSWMQLLDDCADMHDDMRVGIDTFAVKTFRQHGSLNVYWQEMLALSNRVAVVVHACCASSRGKATADVVQFGIFVISSLSFAKMYPLLHGSHRNTFDDATPPIVEFYRLWRESYERAVQMAERDILSIRPAIVGQVIHCLIANWPVQGGGRRRAISFRH